jgi:hypothetical protein
MRKLLALAVVGASLAFSASAALAEGDFTPTPSTPDNNTPVATQPSTPDQGTVAGGSDQDQGPFVQWHYDNMGH